MPDFYADPVAELLNRALTIPRYAEAIEGLDVMGSAMKLLDCRPAHNRAAPAVVKSARPGPVPAAAAAAMAKMPLAKLRRIAKTSGCPECRRLAAGEYRRRHV